MTDNLRSPTFDTARRGYDREQVDEYVASVSDALEHLQRRLEQLDEQVAELQGPRGEDARVELEAVAADVDRILSAARQAAENMRTRASEDAAKWRGEAADEARQLRQAAERDAYQLREAAWEASTEMLDQVSSASDEAMRLAQQDALFIRAEAEREALRLTGDARRDLEEEVRAAKAEADRLIAKARHESESIVEASRQSAEAAQERARALEDRRAELMGELETARSSIDQLENEIDTRRQALQTAGMDDPGVRIVLPDEPQVRSLPEGEWIDDDASVRILPPAERPPKMPEPMDSVDADELVAEVAMLRAAEMSAVDDTAAGEETEVASEAVESHDLEQAVEAVGEDTEVTGEDTEESGGAPTAVADTTDQPDTPHIDELFASLRDEGDAASVDGAEQSGGDLVDDDGTASDRQSGAEAVTEAAEPAPVAAAALDVDPFELRERLLLPIENRALRAIKRTIVGLQNRVLEDLRVAEDDWEPETVMFTAAFESDMETLANEALVAGYVGAGELLGLDQMPQPKGSAPPDPAAAFAGRLVDAVGAAVASSRGGGGTRRQLSSAVSRVFRSWRTDEAGRHVRDAAHLVYHEGLARAFASAGIDNVIGIPRGRSHQNCAAVAGGPWNPAHGAPDGIVSPPASAGCDCTIVPAASAG